MSLSTRTTGASAAAAVAVPTPDPAPALRRLSYARAAFALVWAGLLAVTAADLGPVSVTLLVLYPAVDLAAAAYDVRASGATRARRVLHVNMGLSLATTVALAVAATSGVPDVLRVWGAWAVAAGLVQLVVAAQRRRVGGQVPLVLSGAISVLAGTGFVVMAGGSDASLSGLAGYAALGGIFFLVSAIRLHRGAARSGR